MSLWSRPGDDGLTASDRLIRDLKREGLPDAEIATRVGISVSEVKQRLERLTAAPSTPTPRAPKRPAEPERGRPVAASAPGAIELGWFGDKLARHGKRIIGGAVLLALVAFIGGYYARGTDGATEIVSGIQSGSSVGYGPTFQTVSQVPAPGITVTGHASATVPADAAYVYALLPPGVSLSPEGRFGVETDLRLLGITGDALDVILLDQYEFTAIGVRLTLEDLDALGSGVLNALRGASTTFSSGFVESGIFFVLDNCEGAVAPLWRDAYADAEARAQRLAEATGASLGPVAAIQENELSSLLAIYSGNVRSSCPEGPAGISPFSSPSSGTPDDEPVVDLKADLTVTFAFAGGDAPAQEVVVTGFATASAPADSAHYVGLATNSSGSTVRPQDALPTLRGAMAALGIPSADIESGYNASGYSVLSVPVSLDLPEDDASKIRSAMRAFLGTLQSDGIVFGHSACPLIQGEAEAQALEAAQGRAEAIAAAAGARVVGIQRVITILGQDQGCPARAMDGQVVPYGSPAEVQVTAALAVTFAVEPD